MSRDSIEHGLPWSWRADRVTRAIRDPDTNVVVVDGRGALGAFGIMRSEEHTSELFADSRKIMMMDLSSHHCL